MVYRRYQDIVYRAFLLVIGLGGPLLAAPSDQYAEQIRPLLQKYCTSCHSSEKHKGGLNLDRFASIADIRKDAKSWQATLEMLEAGEMPPENKPQPTAAERQRLISWTREFLNAEALAHAGDPGLVPLRRLSNAEYNYTIRDLTGVDLQPARQLPADGAAGEGFTNAAEALADMSPTLFGKYLLAAKEISAHAVLLPDGFRFAPTKTRHDWTNEIMASVREIYGQYTRDGKLPLESYLLATIRNRESLSSGLLTPEALASREKLNGKFLKLLWQTLSSKDSSFPLDRIRLEWQRASEKDVLALAAEISAWQSALWKIVKIGSYTNNAESLWGGKQSRLRAMGKIGSYADGDTRQVANDPAAAEVQTLRFELKPAPGQREVVLYLCARDLARSDKNSVIVWRRPRLEGTGKPPLLLRDYPKVASVYEADYSAIFADTSKYLATAMEADKNRALSTDQLASRDGLDVKLLRNWIDLLALAKAGSGTEESATPLKIVAADPLKLLDAKTAPNPKYPAINGWRTKGSDLPAVLSNFSDKTEHIPGSAAGHRVVVHPNPAQYVACAWTSPIDGRVRVSAKIAHVHAGCGNGIVWWLEHRRADRAEVLAEGIVGVFGKFEVSPRNVRIGKGESLVLAVDARDGNHNCDLTELNFTIAEAGASGRTWDLAADVADNILDANPHVDKLGNKNVWSFVEGPTRPSSGITSAMQIVTPGSILFRWRDAALDPAQRAKASQLAEEVQKLLCGPRPEMNNDPDRVLYDTLVAANSSLLRDVDVSRYQKRSSAATKYGLPANRFGRHPFGKPMDDASLAVATDTVTEIHLPAALFQARQFVVDVALDGPNAERVVQAQVLATPPAIGAKWDGKTGLVAVAGSAAYKTLLDGFAEFRRCFPMFICFPQIIPTDEVVCLKQFHRDDEPLARLFLDDQQHRRLDQLWSEHRFVSQWPISENKYLPLFIGFTTQDQPKEAQQFFEGFREPFRKRAEEFEKEVESAAPTQLHALLDFAGRAYRRPLQESERDQLLGLYHALRSKGVGHEEAFAGVIARILVSPSFLFKLETPPAGKEPGPVNDWELATRLSYFLWSTAPDQQLLDLAASGQLRQPSVLQTQAQRMLKDDRIRALAIEFGTQWIHVRGFDEFKEKNEKLFPTFDEKLRAAIYEESILFFQDLFQHDQPVNRILDADYTYLNESLARHYAIPGITGPEWRKVTGIQKFGRGGILGLASVQSRQAGASRTSPVLRGNWVVETLLGEKLPRPPADVPRLPEEEGAAGLTTRQMVEKHTSVASCMVCHQRIDPLGFAFERYDAIGRFREKETSGLPIDCHARLKDGTEFEGIDGLRIWLLTKKKDVITRLFCRRLLGYALGRAVVLSDQPLIDEMVRELNRSNGNVSTAVLMIVQSPQFRSIRGSAFGEDE